MPNSKDNKIMHDRPVIAGTRITVSIIIGSLADGMTEDEIKREYDIMAEDSRECLEYSVRMKNKEY